MLSSCKISILMCVYNEEAFIADAIKSVLRQSYQNFELIIVDDGSEDATGKIVKDFLYDDRLSFYQPGKLGKVKANNLAFEKSKGDFITFFSGDDLMLEESLEKRIEPILKYIEDPAISFCRLKTLSLEKRFHDITLPKNSKRGNLCAGCMMINRKFATMSFPIPENLGNEDMWQIQHANFFKNIIVKHISYVGLRYRLHSGNSSNKMDSFNKKNESMHKRFIVYKLFLSKYKEILSKEDINRLSSLSMAEDLRYKRKTFSIILIKNLTFSEKMRFIFYSNRALYSLRKRLFSLFSGWA